MALLVLGDQFDLKLKNSDELFFLQVFVGLDKLVILGDRILPIESGHSAFWMGP